jgi:flavin-binding protein dodecin
MNSQFEVIERVGTLNVSSSDAIKDVVKKAHEDFRVSWFEVIEERGRVTEEGEIEFQVKVKIGKKI